MAKKQRKPVERVVVTTKHRGVFYGTIKKRDGDDLVLSQARNCLFWSRETKGFLGLAATGPLGDSRIGPEVKSLELMGVTSITPCTDAAIERWEAAPWSS